MRFTNGYWLWRDGVVARHAQQVYELEVVDSRLQILATTKPVRHRGDTLNAATIDVDIDSPAEGVIRVRTTHHRGGAEPLRFDLAWANQSIGSVASASALGTADNAVELASGPLTARVATGDDWRIEFVADDRVLMHQGERSIGFVDLGDGSRHMKIQTSLGVGEMVYGLGERFTPFVKNGQSVDTYNEDGGTSSEQAYKNIPFFLTNRGYGVLVNHADRVSFEVGSEVVHRVQFSAETESLEYLVIYGPTPKQILARYTALTGRPPIPPRWSFDLWLSTSFVTDYDEQTVSAYVDEMARRDIPLGVFHFDCFWMREFHWCDFAWDGRVFPDPAGMIERLKQRGLRVSVWINPYIAQRSLLFDEGASRGYFLTRPDGSVWQTDMWQAGMAIVDFTNPDATAWYQDQLRPLLDMGVDAFKTDFGERIPTDVVYHDGSDPAGMHNLYTLAYNRAVWEVLAEHTDEPVVFARSATVGCQTMPVHWGGDNSSTFESMAESLRGGLSLGLCGFAFWSHDIGGFEGSPDPAVFKRWAAFGLLSSHSRLHGNESVRLPWMFGEQAADVVRHFTRLKSAIMPYLMRCAAEANERGAPMMRPMMFEFPDDRTCATLDTQYMFGPDLLVAPVFDAEGEVTFYVPDGRWVHLITGDVVEGPAWVSERHDFDSLPLYVRPDSVIEVAPDSEFEFAPTSPITSARR